MTYEQAYADHKALWAVGAAYDMTGGYVDSEDLDRMLKSPCKRTAKLCLESQIRYWFEAGVAVETDMKVPAEDVLAEHPELHEIAERHGYGYLLPQPPQGEE